MDRKELTKSAHWTIEKMILDGIDNPEEQAYILKNHLASRIADSILLKKEIRELKRSKSE